MLQVSHYSPAERQQQKERQRASDADRLRAGAVSKAELRMENGFLSSLEVLDSSVICQEVFA